MSTSRRAVLVGGGASVCSVAAGAMLAGCGRGGTTHASPTTSGAPVYPGSLALVALSGALEELAVTAYDVATGTVNSPPAYFDAYLATARAHHAEHAAVWQRLLSAAGAPPVVAVDATQAAGTLAALQIATTPHAAAAALLALERTLAATALAVAGQPLDSTTTTPAATIAPVEAQHSAVLSLLLRSAAAPASLLTTSGAAGSDDLRVAPA